MGLIQLILNVAYQILTLLVALPFKWVNDVVETFGSIINLLIPDKGEEYEEEEVIENPYPDPVEVKGFHQQYNDEQKEETE